MSNFVSEQEYLFSRLQLILNDSKESIVLCGIDNNIELIWAILIHLKQQDRVKYIVDFDNSPNLNRYYRGYKISKLNAVNFNEIDTIIVIPKRNNYIIANMVKNAVSKIPKVIKVAGIFSYYTDSELRDFINYTEKAVLKSKDKFVEFNPKEFVAHKNDTKVIAWYLPQFHQLEVNNKFHGQGFTEWTNTSRAIPLFKGHYQPHIPYDVGYYDLLNPESMKRQIYLAKHYGIYGFCFHYYWFSGQKLMEKPLEMLKEHKEWDMPFCINWANENWTSIWDGGNKEIIYEQKLNDDDDEKFILDILPYMKDTRYIKINGKPVLSIYRCDLFEKTRFQRLIKNFRITAQKNGIPDLFIMLTNCWEFAGDASSWGADALVEFHPSFLLHKYNRVIIRPKGYINPYFMGDIIDTTRFIKEKRYLAKYSSKTVFRSALTSWDNTARKAASNGCIFMGFTPETYKTWLKDIMLENKLRKSYKLEEDIVFVNSWNEWAEGSHLEPDCCYGYAYLQATREAIEEMR